MFPKNKIDKIEKKTKANKFQTGIGTELGSFLLNNNNKGGKKRRLSQYEILNKNLNKINIISNNINYINNSEIDYQKKNKPQRIYSIRKKREKILSQINLNIQKTNQNLNNPEEFYSSYFNSLLQGKINNEKTTKRNSVIFARENEDISKVSKEKLNRNSLYKINLS